eukprot:480091-Ditylum_brightwellii.AAC.1
MYPPPPQLVKTTKVVEVTKAKVIKCYFIAKSQWLPVVCGTYQIWCSHVDQANFTNITAARLSSIRHNAISKQFSVDELQQLQLEAISDVQSTMTSQVDEVVESTDLEPQADDANANEDKIDTIKELQSCKDKMMKKTSN